MFWPIKSHIQPSSNSLASQGLHLYVPMKHRNSEWSSFGFCIPSCALLRCLCFGPVFTTMQQCSPRPVPSITSQTGPTVGSAKTLAACIWLPGASEWSHLPPPRLSSTFCVLKWGGWLTNFEHQPRLNNRLQKINEKNVQLFGSSLQVGILFFQLNKSEGGKGKWTKVNPTQLPSFSIHLPQWRLALRDFAPLKFE